jgi:nucleotide-binding universal stress UspA family protein
VDVLRVSGADADADEDARLLEHLAHQGVNARLARRARDGASTARRILEHAAAIGANLVVAGGYGHSRAREYSFGGVTGALYRDAGVPVFLSH